MERLCCRRQQNTISVSCAARLQQTSDVIISTIYSMMQCKEARPSQLLTPDNAYHC